MARPALLWAISCALQRVQAVGVAGHFPNYDDPITSEAPLPHPLSRDRPCEVVDAVVSAEGRGRAVLGAYHPPSRKCSAPWSQVVLQFSGAIAGLQFDRFGALYLRGVELLRLTTPEPSPAGITWRVERDVTDYASLFMSPGDVQLDIQNYVNSKYTGVFELNVSFAFYAGGRPHAPRTLVPLRNVTSQVRPLQSTLTKRGGQVNWVKIPADTLEARLDLYASAHGCEEFWYANVMGDVSGNCGGGAYRELDVYVDGVLAGAQHPFPVLYTGGINPLLWRPLTGILSFDMPPYTFDLTPFLGWLSDGEAHNVTLDVVGQDKGGYWFLNGVLALRRGGNPVQGRHVEVLNDQSLKHSEIIKDQEQNRGRLQETNASRGYHVRGYLVLASGEKVTSEVSGQLSAQTKNHFEGEDTLITHGYWNASRESIYNGTRRTEVTEYPLELSDTYAEVDDSFQIEASIRFARKLAVTFAREGVADSGSTTPSSSGSYAVVLQNEMDNLAVYNRTLRDRIVNVKIALGSASFRLGSDAVGNATSAEHTPCYNRQLSASDGAISEDIGKDACSWPAGVYICGSSLCGEFQPGAELAFGPGEAPHQMSERPSQWDEGVVRAFALARAELPLRSPAELGKHDAKHSGSDAMSGTEVVGAVGAVAGTPKLKAESAQPEPDAKHSGGDAGAEVIAAVGSPLDSTVTAKPKAKVVPAQLKPAQLWSSAPHAELRGITIDASQRSAAPSRGALALVVSAGLFGATLITVAAVGYRRQQWAGRRTPDDHLPLDTCEPDLLE